MRSAESRSSLLEGLRDAVARHLPLLSNASFLTIGTAVSSGLGFIYWWFAARHFTPHAVGLASAGISLMGLLGLMGEFGLGTLLVGETQRLKERGPSLIWAALIAALACSAFCGVLYLACVSWLSIDLRSLTSNAWLSLMFVAGAAFTGFVLTLDQALVGLLRSSLQMLRNAAFSVLKLALLVVAAYGFGSAAQEGTILATWVVGMIASVMLLGLALLRLDPEFFAPPDFGILRPLAGKVATHHLLNLVTQAPGLILPFLVTVLLSPEVNAAFYAAWMLINVALLLPASLATVLFTVGSQHPASLPERLRFSLRLCTLFGIAAAVGFFLFSDFALRLFSPAYPAIAGTSLQYMGLGVLAVMVKYHYMAIERLNDRMAQASLVLGIGAVLELALATLGARFGNGLAGLAHGWLLASFLQAAFVLPAVLRAANPPAYAPQPSR